VNHGEYIFPHREWPDFRHLDDIAGSAADEALPRPLGLEGGEGQEEFERWGVTGYSRATAVRRRIPVRVRPFQAFWV
jgi:hypothetical protein